MSIDEHLEIERQRGNIITGGGSGFICYNASLYTFGCGLSNSPESQSAPTSSGQLAIDAEMDGIAEGELKAEEKMRVG